MQFAFFSDPCVRIRVHLANGNMPGVPGITSQTFDLLTDTYDIPRPLYVTKDIDNRVYLFYNEHKVGLGQCRPYM